MSENLPSYLRHKLALAFDQISSSEDADNILEHAATLVREKDERSPILHLADTGKLDNPFVIPVLYSVDGSVVRSKFTFASLNQAPLTLSAHTNSATNDNTGEQQQQQEEANSKILSFPVCPLQDFTKKDHDAAARIGGRNVRYVLLWKKCKTGPSSINYAFASANDLDVAVAEEAVEKAKSLRLFRINNNNNNNNNEKKEEKEEEEDKTAQTVVGPNEQNEETIMMMIVHVDAARCHITGPAVVRILSRPSSNIETIERISEEIKVNPQLVSSTAIESAMVQACGWIADTMRLVDEKWIETVKEVQFALKCAQQPISEQIKIEATSGVSIRGGLALHLIEGLLKRHGALQALDAKLNAPSSPFAILLTKSDPGSEVHQQWIMRLARLSSDLELARSEAACVSILSRSFLAIKLHRCETNPRGIDALRDVADDLGIRLFLACCILDKSLDRDDQDRRVTSSFFVDLLLPVIAADFISACERAMMFETLFTPTANNTASSPLLLNVSSPYSAVDVAAVASASSPIEEDGENQTQTSLVHDEDDSQTVQQTPSFTPIEKNAPLAASQSVQARLVESASVLRGWAAAYRRAGLALSHPCLELQRRWISVSPSSCEYNNNSENSNNSENNNNNFQNENFWNIESFEKSPAHDVLYAADRCMDLYKFIQQIDRAGLGLQTPQVRCLFSTLHEAAEVFPLLRSGQHRNWSVIAEKFDRSLTLQYTTIDKKTQYTNLPFDVNIPTSTVTNINDSNVSVSSVTSNNNSNISASFNTTTATEQQQQQNYSPASTQALLSEHSVLSLRVAQLTEELKETRHTLRTSASDVKTLKESLNKTLEDNEVLRDKLSSTLTELANLKNVN